MDKHAEQDPWVMRLRDEELQGAALAELRQILLRGLRRAFDGKGGGESFCEDVTQEALLKILDKLDQFSGRSRFTTWAMSIAVRIGTSQFRRKQFQDVSIDGLGSEQDLSLSWKDERAVSPELHEDRNALLQKLQGLIEAELTERQRQATQAIMQGMPVEEIARRTSSNRNAVYKLIHDARVRLKNGLESAGYTPEDIRLTIA